MKKHLLLLFFLAHSANSTECSIESFSKVYRSHKGQAIQTKDFVINSDCENDILNKISALLSNAEGTLGTDFIKTEIKKDYPEATVTFSLSKISLLELSDSLKEQLANGTNLSFFQTRSLNGLNTLGLFEGERMSAICDSCQTLGEKTIKIDITNPITNSNRALWFNSKIMAKIKVVKAIRNISFQQKNLNSQDFYIDEVNTMSADNSLTTLENIQFYKSNKTIMQNSVVSNLDLQAINLVNYGTPVQVSLLSQNISLHKSAMPLRSARYGDIVELKGPNNKNLTGKVVDFNKVVIEL